VQVANCVRLVLSAWVIGAGLVPLGAAVPTPVYLSEFGADAATPKSLATLGEFVTTLVRLRLASVHEVRLNLGAPPGCQPDTPEGSGGAPTASSGTVFLTVGGALQGSDGSTASMQYEVNKVAGCVPQSKLKRTVALDDESALRTFSAMAEDVARVVGEAASNRVWVYPTLSGTPRGISPRMAKDFEDDLNTAFERSDIFRLAPKPDQAEYLVKGSWVTSGKGAKSGPALQFALEPKGGEPASLEPIPAPSTGESLGYTMLSNRIVNMLADEHLRRAAQLSGPYATTPPQELLRKARQLYCQTPQGYCDPDARSVVALLAQRIAEMEPRDEAYDLLGSAYRDLDRDLDARDAFKAAAAAATDRSKATEYTAKAAEVALTAGDAKGAVALLIPSVTAGSAPDSYLALVRAQQELGQQEEAIQTLVRGMQAHRDSENISAALLEQLKHPPDDVEKRKQECDAIRSVVPAGDILAACLYSAGRKLQVLGACPRNHFWSCMLWPSETEPQQLVLRTGEF
jgi:tetratricopeptide (TPR) repeat protein